MRVGVWRFQTSWCWMDAWLCGYGMVWYGTVPSGRYAASENYESWEMCFLGDFVKKKCTYGSPIFFPGLFRVLSCLSTELERTDVDPKSLSVNLHTYTLDVNASEAENRCVPVSYFRALNVRFHIVPASSSLLREACWCIGLPNGNVVTAVL